VSDKSVAPEVMRIAEEIQEARASRTPLRVVGRGTWLDAGRSCDASRRLEIGGLTGITRYEPGDLTLTARAGTSLADIASATGAEGQWLTLDAHGSPDGTLGATVATSSAGPLSSAYGTPRDHVLGCEFVSGTGDVIRAGGRVVKNVAGFDLTRLVTGAWGTLGAITEITVRLRARPEVDRTVAVEFGDAHAVWNWLRLSEYTPLSAELLSPVMATKLSLSGAGLLVRLGGNAAFVRAAGDAVAALGAQSEVDAAIWNRFTSSEPADTIVLRVSALPSRIGELWPAASAFAESNGGYAQATVSRGVVRCVLPMNDANEHLEAVRAGIVELGRTWTVVGERMPASLWPTLSQKKTTHALAQGVRRAFDPDGIMNPGILDVA
jgi:glycolate oxidase FAD binding subunit